MNFPLISSHTHLFLPVLFWVIAHWAPAQQRCKNRSLELESLVVHSPGLGFVPQVVVHPVIQAWTQK